MPNDSDLSVCTLPLVSNAQSYFLYLELIIVDMHYET